MMRYCKAYKNSEIRKFYASHSQAVPVLLESEGISFLWDDFMVRKSPLKHEEVVCEHVTEEWKDFCKNQLSFCIPEKTSLQEAPMVHAQSLSAGNTFIPFTSGQRWLIEELTCTGDFFSNVPLLQLCMQKMSIRELEQVLLYLFQYHDALRSKLTYKNKQWQQFIVASDDVLPATWICLSRLSASEQMILLKSIAHEMQRQINTLQGFLWHFSFCEVDETHGYILWILNHFITDAMSNQILLQDFHTLHNQMLQGKTLKLPKQKTRLREWAERMTSYLDSPEAQQEIHAYWSRLPWELIKPIPLDSPAGMTLDPLTSRPGYGTCASSCNYYFSLAPAQTQLLLSTAASLHVQLLDMLLAAMAQTIASWSDSNVISLFVQDNARFTMFKDVSLLHTVGFIAHARRLLFDLRTATSAKEALELVKSQLEQAPNHGRSLDWFLRQESVPEDLKHIPWSDVYFNFGGKSATGLKQDSLSSFMLEYPAHYRYHILLCEACIVKDRLEIKWEYSMDTHREATIAKFAGYFLEILCNFRADYALQAVGEKPTSERNTTSWKNSITR